MGQIVTHNQFAWSISVLYGVQHCSITQCWSHQLSDIAQRYKGAPSISGPMWWVCPLIRSWRTYSLLGTLSSLEAGRRMNCCSYLVSKIIFAGASSDRVRISVSAAPPRSTPQRCDVDQLAISLAHLWCEVWKTNCCLWTLSQLGEVEILSVPRHLS